MAHGCLVVWCLARSNLKRRAICPIRSLCMTVGVTQRRREQRRTIVIMLCYFVLVLVSGFGYGCTFNILVSEADSEFKAKAKAAPRPRLSDSTASRIWPLSGRTGQDRPAVAAGWDHLLVHGLLMVAWMRAANFQPAKDLFIASLARFQDGGA